MTAMDLRAGTSGFSYPAWKGPFYPSDLPAAKMLNFYANRLPTVEINNTFYRLPRASVLRGWAQQVPDDFRFVIKASRRITHAKDREAAGDALAYLLSTVQALGKRCGALLFQLPPYRRYAPELLEQLLSGSRGFAVAFEFRHPSWFVDATYARLATAGAALVAADFDDPDRGAPLVRTAPWGYARLRAASYDDDALRSWLARLRDAGFEAAFLFFKHEDEGVAPLLAERVLSLAASN